MIIISGNKNEGKTTQIKRVVSYLKQKGIAIGGFYSEKVLENNTLVGYDIVMVDTNKSYPFLRLKGEETQQKIGCFYIDGFTLAEGVKQLKKAIDNKVKTIFIDEVGKLELNNQGWTIAVEKLINNYKGKIILAIRSNFVNEIIKKWKFEEVYQYGISENDFKKIIYFS